MKTIFITGGTGYIGTRLIKLLVSGGHRVIALVRKGSEARVPAGTEVVIGNPFDAQTFKDHIPPGSVFIQLLGVPHPSPRKANLFRDIDLRSVKASADAAAFTGTDQFIYVSVALTPSKLMHAYQEVRREGEQYCLSKKLNCTFIRPWYVLGPGHWWPVALLPVYGLAELVPAWKVKARAMALVTIRQMLQALVHLAVSEPCQHRIVEIKDIRKLSNQKVKQQKTLRQKPSYL